MPFFLACRLDFDARQGLQKSCCRPTKTSWCHSPGGGAAPAAAGRSGWLSAMVLMASLVSLVGAVSPCELNGRAAAEFVFGLRLSRTGKADGKVGGGKKKEKERRSRWVAGGLLAARTSRVRTGETAGWRSQIRFESDWPERRRVCWRRTYRSRLIVDVEADRRSFLLVAPSWLACRSSPDVAPIRSPRVRCASRTRTAPPADTRDSDSLRSHPAARFDAAGTVDSDSPTRQSTDATPVRRPVRCQWHTREWVDRQAARSRQPRAHQAKCSQVEHRADGSGKDGRRGGSVPPALSCLSAEFLIWSFLCRPRQVPPGRGRRASVARCRLNSV